MSVTTETTIPGYIAGTWTIDPVHSEVGFSVRHMMVSKVRGKFNEFSGQIVTAASPLDSSASVTIDLHSIDTGNHDRDNHIRSADFFDVDVHPQVRFTSTRITGLGNGRVHVRSELEVAGTPVPVAFDASVRVIDGELELEATTTVDQRRLGMSQGPLRNVRPPTKMHVKTRLVRERPE